MAKVVDLKAPDFVTLDELKGERSDLYDDWQIQVERFRKQLWYRCSPGSVDREGFPKVDAQRVQNFSMMVEQETGKKFRAPRLRPYQDGASLL